MLHSHWTTVFPNGITGVNILNGEFVWICRLRWNQPFSSLVVNSRCCQIYLVSWGGGSRCSKLWKVDSIWKRFSCNQCIFKTSSQAERKKGEQQQQQYGPSCAILTSSESHTHTECLTACEPWREEHSRAGQCSCRTAARPPPPQLWIYAQKPELDESCGRQVCAFGSEHHNVSKPSKRKGKLHTRTQTHTFLHTHSQSPSFCKNKENIRCCLFSMFYCWAMLGRSFVQSTKYTYNSCILFFYNFQRDVVDSAHCKRQLQPTFICK